MEICQGDSFNVLAKLIHTIIQIIQIAIPIMLIIWGMLDLGKAVIASKEDEIKAAQKLLVKRVIAAVLVFLVVTIVTLVLSLVAQSGGDTAGAGSWNECWQAIMDA